MLRSGTLPVVAALGVLFGGGVAAAKALHVAPEHNPVRAAHPSFSVVLTTAGSGIAATCEEGCAWRTITAEQPSGEYTISSAGVRPLIGEVADLEEVAFIFHIAVVGTDGGVRARCEHGCNWRSVTGSYPNGAYRIRSDGIEPVRSIVR